MNADVELKVEQVLDGVHYRGHTKIGLAKFDYELKFGVPIPDLDDMEIHGEEAVRRIFQITLKKDGAPIDLVTKDEYGFFFRLLVMFAAEFYYLPQTRDSQEGFVGTVLRGEFSIPEIKATIGMTSHPSLDLSPELCLMLNSEKFGCAIPA